HRLALVAGAGPQRAEVVHAGEEYRAQYHPQERRPPAPDHGDGRTHDRGRAGDGGEVVAPEHEAVGRDVVHAVAHGVCRGRIVRLQAVDLLGDELGVEGIAQRHRAKPDQQQDDRIHGYAPCPNGRPRVTRPPPPASTKPCCAATPPLAPSPALNPPKTKVATVRGAWRIDPALQQEQPVLPPRRRPSVKAFSKVAWAALALLGAFCLATIALRRGEQINAL